jgi:hypothetical protein
VKVARVGTVIGALLAVGCLNFDAVAFESAPLQVPSSAPTSSVLPEFFDSSRLPDLRDAWHTSIRSGDRSGGDGAAISETPAANEGANPAGTQPVRRRAEELSGRFSDGASAGDLAGKSGRKPDAPDASSKAPPTDLSEAAMPSGTPVMSHMGAVLPVPPAADDVKTPAALPVAPPADDVTTTATLPDVATDEPPSAAKAPNATWLKVGLPPLPVRSPKDAKAHAKAVGGKTEGATAKATEKSTGAKSTAGKVAAAKVPEKDAGKDDDEKPVRQFRAPVVTHAAPAQPRLDPGRKEVFPPYIGAFGWQPK